MKNQNNSTMYLHKKLNSFCKNLIAEFDQISDTRKTDLEKLSSYISQKISSQQPVRLTVICTHNSRRSHIGQAWLAAAAAFFDIQNVHTFSGGTEATAFNHRSVTALRRAGFEIEKLDDSDNPIYKTSFGNNFPKMKMFSKKFDTSPNPNNAFAAIMVCTDADDNCPFVPGADGRFSLPFDDPKNFDDTDLEIQKYDERVQQIGREMFYVMGKI